MQAIKFRAAHQVRRDSIPVHDLTLDSLRQLFTDLFSIPSTVHFRYLDDQQEWVDLSTERELTEALRIVQGRMLEIKAREQFCQRRRGAVDMGVGPIPPFRHFVRKHEAYVHPAICDGCDNNIVGIRHKCNECPDYDLCSNCIDQSTTIHPDHTFQALERTIPFIRRCMTGPTTSPVQSETDDKQTAEELIRLGRFGPRGLSFRLFGKPATSTDVFAFRHPAKCDNCSQQIVGVRHKCNDCPDYDLCANCVTSASSVHPQHTFNALERSYHRHSFHSRRRSEEKPDTVVEAQTETPAPVVDAPEPTAEVPAETVEMTPVDAPTQEKKMTKEALTQALDRLKTMGFDDNQKNVRLLLACDGDVSVALEQLLEEC